VDIKVDVGFHENTKPNQAEGAASRRAIAWIALLHRHRPSPASNLSRSDQLVFRNRVRKIYCKSTETIKNFATIN